MLVKRASALIAIVASGTQMHAMWEVLKHLISKADRPVKG